MIEQLAVYIRSLGHVIGRRSSINEVFRGFLELSTTNASTISDSLLGNLSRWGLNIERLRWNGVQWHLLCEWYTVRGAAKDNEPLF